MLLFLSSLLLAEKPKLLLLKSYKPDNNVIGWLMSEKLDGVRAYWNGKKLLSRSGKIFASPKSFTKGFPPFEIDGELWTKREDFEHIISIVNRQNPHKAWKELSYNIFEVPHQKGGLLERLEVLKIWLKKHPNTFIKIIPQKECKSSKDLEQHLNELDKKGAEGLVVRDPNVPYLDRRTSKALKVKHFDDAECKVIAYTKGKGKFKGLLGALRCEWKDRVLKIGSGFSLKERKNPPQIGERVTFKYNGLTRFGNPRFPVFLRVRKGI